MSFAVCLLVLLLLVVLYSFWAASALNFSVTFSCHNQDTLPILQLERFLCVYLVLLSMYVLLLLLQELTYHHPEVDGSLLCTDT